MSTFNCKECEYSTEEVRSFSAHIFQKHGLTKQAYFDRHLKQKGSGACLYCKKNTSFRGWDYQQFCSTQCSGAYKAKTNTCTSFWKGKKQPKQMVRKRLANTKQSVKERTRKKTMRARYGSLDTQQAMSKHEIALRIQRLREAHTGKKMPTRSVRQIIETKRRNGTLGHTEETKKKIRASVIATLNADSFDKSVFITSGSRGRGHKTGKIHGLTYRSSYEKEFIRFCRANKIRVETAETKEFSVLYKSKLSGIMKTYYPDFFLSDYNLVVEIKPSTMLNIRDNSVKHKAAAKELNFCVLTDKDGLLDNWDKLKEKLNEHILSIGVSKKGGKIPL